MSYVRYSVECDLLYWCVGRCGGYLLCMAVTEWSGTRFCHAACHICEGRSLLLAGTRAGSTVFMIRLTGPITIVIPIDSGAFCEHVKVSVD